MPLGTIGLGTYRWGNARKAWLLLGLYPVITAVLLWWQIYAIQFLLHHDGYLTHDRLSDLTWDIYLGWGWLALLAMAAWFWYAWTHHSSIIRGLCLSQPISSAQDPSLYAMLEAICISQGIPTPELEIIDTPARNSFVTALGPDDSYRVFLTKGLIESLQRDELEAVLAHEVAHILNGDTRLISVSIAFTDLYPLLVNYKVTPAIDESPAAAEARSVQPLNLMVHPVAFVLLMPIALGFIAISIIRVFLFLRREHDADAVALEITKNPDALMRALLRIHRHAFLPFATRDIRFLCIDNPKGGFFSTHPRLSSRLRVISEISGTPIPEIEPSVAAHNSKRFRDNPLLRRTFRKDHNSGNWFHRP